MPGLLNNQSAGKASTAQQDTGSAAPSGEEPNVTAEEQAQYDEFVSNGMNLLHDEKNLDGMLQALSGDGNPVEGLANVVASIVMRVEDSAEKNGVQISGDVLMQGGTNLLEQAAELVEEAGIHEFSEDELGTAVNMAMDIYRSARQQQGKLPTEQLGAEMQELQAAEQDGSLEQLIPGITEHAGRESVAPGAGTAAQPQKRGLLG